MSSSDEIKNNILRQLSGGYMPEKMLAWTIRQERLGSPEIAFQEEEVEIPPLRSGEILVANIAAGVNYNGIWAALGKPKDVIRTNGDYLDEKQPFHICGSESSGIVYAVADDVTEFEIGDEVCVGGARYDVNCPLLKDNVDPCFSPTYHIWGYEGNYGAYAQFSRVQVNQCVKKPSYLTWEEAAAITATGVTVYRMLNHWEGNKIRKGDVVLIWGGTGGIGMSAIQLVSAQGGIPVAVVSSDEKGKICMEEGAVGYINRTNYHHWGRVSTQNEKEYQKWLIQATKLRNELYRIVGEKRLADIVIEHPGGDTLPTSLFLCRAGGMVVLCGATSSYFADIDLRFLWLNQKRIQGSHAGTLDDYEGYTEILERHQLHPHHLNIHNWEELPIVYQRFSEKGIIGKSVIKIGVNADENRFK